MSAPGSVAYEIGYGGDCGVVVDVDRGMAGYRFAVPMTGRHVRRVFDEWCPSS